jgi:PAS domain S-box-containing protein
VVTPRGVVRSWQAVTNDGREEFEAARMHPWSWDSVSDRVIWSRGVADLFGVPLDEFDGTLAAFLELVHPDDRAAISATIERAFADGTVQFEVEHRTLRRPKRWLHGRGEVGRDETGKPIAIRGIVYDITARKEIELRDARMRRLLAVVAAINRESARGDSGLPAAACRIAVEEGGFRFAWIGQRDSSGRLVPLASAGHEDGYLELAAVRAIGTSPEEGPTMRAIRERRPIQCPDIATDPSFERWRDEALARGYRSSAAFPFERDGVAIGTLNVYADQPSTFAEEEVHLLSRLATDIGNALDRLEREERYRALFEQAGDGIVVFDEKRAIIDANTAFCAMHGYAREELVGKSIADLIGEPDYLERMKVKATLERGDVFHGERTGLRRDGTKFDVETTVKMLRSGVRIAIVRDVSERNRMRGAMEQNERLLALGRLARGVAHEINNPLSYVVLSFDDLERATSSGDRPRALGAIESAREGAERIRRIVRDLSAFGRGDEEAIGPVDLRAMLGSALNLTESMIKPRARVVTDFRATRAAKGNTHRLGQVAVNLLVNAADAVAEGAPNRNEIRVSTQDDGDDVVFSISDTGAGMNRETMSRAFDPFFTTKPIGEGTGLGLAIAHGIVTKMGGTIALESDIGRGTTFAVRLPAWVADAEPAPITPASTTTSNGKRRILIVDDDARIRVMLAKALDDHDVTVASGAFEAAKLCAENDYDCILSDVTMPAGDGVDLIDALRAQSRGHDRRVVFMSGGAYSPRTERLLADASNELLDKPFTFEQARAAIARIIAKPR